MLKIYRILSFLAIPWIIINIYLRIIQNKEDKKRYKERFGKNSITKPLKEVIWIHAASVGEFKSAHIIIEAYYEKYSVLVTTTTKTAAEYALKYYSDKIIHQYAPFDVEIWVKKFIKFWKPKLVLWIESDLWPNTLFIIRKNKVNSLLLNARISPKSFNRWKKISKSYNTLLQTFENIYAQSKDDLIRIQSLSNKKIEFIGNLKLAKNKKIIFQKKENTNISIMIASSHIGEEEELLPIIKKIYYKYLKIQFYLAPRHPERSNKINKIFQKQSFNSSIESVVQKNKSRITIINSFGNLSNYFKKSDIVILGGSILNHGGHNPIEPALHNCAIISGENIFNWQNIYEEMAREESCFIFNNLDKLDKILEKLINNENILNKLKQNALNFTQKKFFNEEKLKNIINSKLIKNA